MEKEWYVVNVYSGHENKVKEKLEMRASSMGMEDYIHRVVVPEQYEIVVNKKGEEVKKGKKMFPGYILIEMVMTDEAWYVVRNTPGVTGFIGSSGKGAKPFPLTPAEVDRTLGAMGMSRLEIGNDLNIGDKVKVISGPFSSMLGVVNKINIETQELEISIDLFGQETIVELNLSQIERA